ncbi:DnaJ family domain-containing protein [Nocardia sp. R7R-8]|uniref:DnaJ family domain-containing protein n=1 Tax=Nocardia sp. R7R-8 TaxID=3459304 RepID=UPI00403DA14A
MTERKPPKHTFESWVDKQIREAAERGELDNLPGTGKPIPGVGTTPDEDWWLRAYLRREGVSGDALLPPSLLLRRDIEHLPETVRDATSEREVRTAVSELNKRIVDWLRMPQGPFVPIAPVNADEIVEQWGHARSAARPTHAQPVRDSAVPARTPDGGIAPRPRRRWWRRWRRHDTEAG